MANPESLLEARKRLQKALKVRPNDPLRVLQLASVLEQLDAWSDLRRLLDAAVQRMSGNDELRMTRARVYGYLGDFSSARDDYLHVMRHTPGHAEALCALVYQGHDEEAGGLAAIEARLEAADLTATSRDRLEYARGRLLEKAGLFEDAFAVYRRVNASRAAQGGMDLDAKLRGARAVVGDLRREMIERLGAKGHPSRRPVFIVGMPRSGTSLTEQVLGSHPQVYAAGERLFWGETLRRLILSARDPSVPLLVSIDNSHPQAWKRAGAGYLKALAQVNGSAKHVTDKLPANFALLPYVRLVFPHAKVIHVRRSAAATLASCMRTPFSDPALAFTLENWARFYGMYQGLMDCWRPILGSQMLEVDYELLVSDFPAQARRVVDFLGLRWDEACLHPEANRQAVRTASVEQVRRSVHTDSLEAWQRYGPELEALLPLADATRAQVIQSARAT